MQKKIDLFNRLIASSFDDRPIAEKPFEATFRIKFLPITPSPTNPKSNISLKF